MSSTKQGNLTYKDYLNLSSCCVSLMFFGSVNCWNHILPFYLKSIYNESENTNKYYIENSILQNSFNLSILILIVSNLFKFFGTYFNKYLGLKNTLLISYFLLILSNVILLFTKGIFQIYLSIFLYSISNGISFLSILEEMWKIFPISRGLITGILNSSNIFGIFIFNPFYDYLRNDNLFLVINSTLFSLGCVFILFCLNIKEKKKKKERRSFNENNSENLQELNEALNSENNDENVNEYINENVSSDEEENKAKKEKKELLKMFSEIFSFKYVYIISSFLLLLASIYIVSISYLSFMYLNTIPMIKYKKVYFYIYMISYSISSILFGYLYDFKGFRNRIIYLITSYSFSLLLFIPLFKISFLIFIIEIINASALGGINTMLLPVFYKEFSSEFCFRIMGLTLSLSSIVYFVIPILMKKLVFNLFGCIVFYIFAFLLNIEAYSLITNFLYPVNLSLLSKEQEYKIDLNKQDELRELATE